VRLVAVARALRRRRRRQSRCCSAATTRPRSCRFSRAAPGVTASRSALARALRFAAVGLRAPGRAVRRLCFCSRGLELPAHARAPWSARGSGEPDLVIAGSRGDDCAVRLSTPGRACARPVVPRASDFERTPRGLRGSSSARAALFYPRLRVRSFKRANRRAHVRANRWVVD